MHKPDYTKNNQNKLKWIMISPEIPRIIAEIVSSQFFPSFLFSHSFFFLPSVFFLFFFSPFPASTVYFFVSLFLQCSLFATFGRFFPLLFRIFSPFFFPLFPTLAFAFLFISCHPIQMLDEVEVQIMLNNLIFSYMPRNPRTELEYDMYEGENNNQE